MTKTFLKERERRAAMSDEVNHEISLEEAYKGGEKDITVNRRVVLRSCRLRPEPQVWKDQWHYRIEEFEVPSDERCTWDRQKLKLQIDRAIMFGDRAHFPSMGSQLPKHIPGDALVTIKVRKDPRFKRLGDDLMAEMRVSLSEALLGFKRELVHLDGHIVTFGMNRGDGAEAQRRLGNRGRRHATQGGPSAGKLVIRFHIDFPQSIPPSAGNDLEAALSKLPGQSKGSPRKHSEL